MSESQLRIQLRDMELLLRESRKERDALHAIIESSRVSIATTNSSLLHCSTQLIRARKALESIRGVAETMHTTNADSIAVRQQILDHVRNVFRKDDES